MINRIIVAIMSLFLVCGVEAAPRNKVVSKGKKQESELFVRYKSINHNLTYYTISINSENYIYYDDRDFKLIFYGKNYSEIFGNVEQFIIDTENACIEANNKYISDTFHGKDYKNIQQTTTTKKGFYSENLIDRPLYQFNYVVDNNIFHIQLLVRENEWNKWNYVYAKDISKNYCTSLISAFVTSYNDYLERLNVKQNAIRVSNKEIHK